MSNRLKLRKTLENSPSTEHKFRDSKQKESAGEPKKEFKESREQRPDQNKGKFQKWNQGQNRQKQ